MSQRFNRNAPPSFKGPRVNERITAPTVRVIDEEGQQVGILPVEEARDIAQERGYDLVEISPGATPPVCRVMDYGKYKYEDKKRKAEARRKQVTVEVKEIKLRPKTEDHDLNVKMRKARQFLEDGNKVKITVRFRGREIIYAESETLRILELAKDVEDVSSIEVPPKREGRQVVMILTPEKKKPEKKKAKPQTPSKEPEKKPEQPPKETTE